METSPKPTLEATEEQSTLFQVASRDHANPTVVQESDSEKKMRDTSGRKCLEQFGKYSPDGSWAKTFAGFLVGMEGWYSTRCRLIWKLRDTKSSRYYFQLAPSVLRTSGNESGLLLTPKAQECTEKKETFVKRMKDRGANCYPSLTSQVLDNVHRLLPTVQTQGLKVCNENGTTGFMDLSLLPSPRTRGLLGGSGSREMMETCVKEGQFTEEEGTQMMGVKLKGLLPTPEANNYKNGHRSETDRIIRKKEQGWTIGLNDQATLGMLPTPTAVSDVKGGCTRIDPKRQNDTLAHAMHAATGGQTGKTSQLNPRFVAEMMGYPPDWLELPFQNTGKNQSKDTETPWFLR